MNGYFSVFDPTGKKIADCGALRDAVTLIGFRNAKWEGHYYQFTPCLLYTSPSPRDATLSRMPSSA